MNKILLAIAWPASAVICLAAGFFIANVTSSPGDPEIVTITKSVAAAPRDAKDDETVASLRSRLKVAEDRIAELTAATPGNANANANANAQQRWGRMSDEELALLKTQDPARYAEEMRRREERDAARAEWLESRRQGEENRDDFFAKLDMEGMGRRDRATLESFVNDYQALRDLMSNGGRDANGQQIDPAQMRQLGRDLMNRAEEARRAILKDYARRIGYNDRQQSEQFIASIEDMFKATSLPGFGGPGRNRNNATPAATPTGNTPNILQRP